MGCLLVCFASFMLSTAMVIVGLALPVWYKETYPERNEESYSKGNLWRVCWLHLEEGNETEHCQYTYTAYQGKVNYFSSYEASIGLAGSGLILSLLSLIFYVVWSCHRKRDFYSNYRISMEGVFAAVWGFLAGGCMIGACVVFSVTLKDLIDNGQKHAAFWICLAGSILQCLVSLCALIFIICAYCETTKSPDVDVMMHSAVQTIQIVEQRGKFSKA